MTRRRRPYLCRVTLVDYQPGFRRRPANPLIRPSLYRSGGSLLWSLVGLLTPPTKWSLGDAGAGKCSTAFAWRKTNDVFCHSEMEVERRPRLLLFLHRWAMASNAKNRNWLKKDLCDGNFGSAAFGQIRIFWRTRQECPWYGPMAGLPAEGTSRFRDPEWVAQSRPWGTLEWFINPYMFHGGTTSASWMWLLSWER